MLKVHHPKCSLNLYASSTLRKKDNMKKKSGRGFLKHLRGNEFQPIKCQPLSLYSLIVFIRFVPSSTQPNFRALKSLEKHFVLCCVLFTIIVLMPSTRPSQIPVNGFIFP